MVDARNIQRSAITCFVIPECPAPSLLIDDARHESGIAPHASTSSALPNRDEHPTTDFLSRFPHLY